LRKETRFDDIGMMTRQMDLDADKARQILSATA
jgi:hypothetical protein